MAYLADTAAFEMQRAKWRKVIRDDVTFPEQIFKRPEGPFLFFEFGLFFTARFFESLKQLLHFTNETVASLGVVEPDPERYFYREFRKYPFVSFSVQESAEDYLKGLSEDPGGSSADAPAFNSSKVVVFPASLRWQIFGDREFEWAVLNCMSQDIYKVFVQSCGLLELREAEDVVPYLKDVISIGGDKGIQFDWVDTLIKNYSNKASAGRRN